jgi:hypothetical protein
MYEQGGDTEPHLSTSFNTTNHSYGPDPDEHANIILLIL